jgi:hypothetical protein
LLCVFDFFDGRPVPQVAPLLHVDKLRLNLELIFRLGLYLGVSLGGGDDALPFLSLPDAIV